MATLRRDRDQIWAEAVAMWRTGEPLTLDDSLYQAAMEAQASAQEEEPWESVIAEFAARKVPLDWNNRTPDQRLLWWSDDFGQGRETCLAERDRLCVAEVWAECFHKDAGSLDRRVARRINGVLRTLPGWKDGGIQRTPYGKQRSFVRKTI